MPRRASCALNAFGVKSIAVVTPYQVNGDEQVDLYFSECGFEVRAVKGLKRPTAISIAETTEDELREALLELNETGADALVQVGTNMGMVRLARRGRALARQAGARDQRRDLVDGAAPERHRGQALRLRPHPRGVLTPELLDDL